MQSPAAHHPQSQVRPRLVCSSLTPASFVDRYMFMHYLGGGVGITRRMSQRHTTISLNCPTKSLARLTPAKGGDSSDSDSEDESSEEEQDKIDVEPESNDADDEIMLGPEAGEDGMQDPTGDLGYTEL
ncbi:hypothetical protein B0H19DRAFT_1383368 [Mycena capillaripes]|nr:hypothetical protein B0H19DRAFT_1383368 [Mycena capillaripes]